MSKETNGPRVIVALDYSNTIPAWELANLLDPNLCRLKVGKELFTAGGPFFVERLQQHGFDVFLDLKLHDIPNTVAQTCKVIASMGVWMTNVHALGGRKMMEAASEAMTHFSKSPKLIAVTIPTSMEAEDLEEVGISNSAIPVLDEVKRLARLAHSCGLDGVVSSPREASHLRHEFGTAFDLVTPGIRDKNAPPDDQARTMTATEAIKAGANYLVIGRPITKAANPLLALQQAQQQVAFATDLQPA